MKHLQVHGWIALYNLYDMIANEAVLGCVTDHDHECRLSTFLCFLITKPVLITTIIINSVPTFRSGRNCVCEQNDSLLETIKWIWNLHKVILVLYSCKSN